jgi:hypothetical protein
MAPGISPVDPHRLAKHGHADVLGHVEADQPIEKSDPEQPDIHCHAGHQPEHRRDADLEPGPCHEPIMVDMAPVAKASTSHDSTETLFPAYVANWLSDALAAKMSLTSLVSQVVGYKSGAKT